MQQIKGDKVGIGWRQELAAEIGNNIDTAGDIECLEVIAEEYFGSPDAQKAGLAALGRLVPLSLHGVSLGLASTLPLETSIADRMARLCEQVRPVFWSEHLSFVRGAGHEIGHLAAPPRSEATVEYAIRNARTAAGIVGAVPALENIATLMDPPCSTMGETHWLSAILQQSEGGMLLDLHNLYANAWNFGTDVFEMLDELPLHKVKQIHLSGGVMIPAPGRTERLLDDHVHDVPEPCFALLEEVAARSTQPLFVIIERDGRYPSIAVLIQQIRRAKKALQTGRQKQAANLEALEVTHVGN